MNHQDSRFNLNNINNLTDEEIKNHIASNGYSFLMIASQTGNIEAVSFLISKNLNVNQIGKYGESAASLAFANGHHEVVMTLLRANSKIPHNYRHERASEDLKAFVELSEEMHEKVKKVNEKNRRDLNETKKFLKEIIENNLNLRYFYNSQNNSLLRNAVINTKISIFEFLISFKLRIAFSEEKFSISEIKKIRDINCKLSFDLFPKQMIKSLRDCGLIDETIEVLMQNCKVCPDNFLNFNYMNAIRKALDYLYKIPYIAIILKVVAASKSFKLFFDFEGTSASFMDPTFDSHAKGNIFISVKELLTSNEKNACAEIAVNLVFFAMHLVYKNKGKPYKKNDKVKKNKFNEIFNELKYNNLDNIFSSIFNNSKNRKQMVIIRLIHIIVLSWDNPVEISKKREDFASLFEFYEQRCLSHMEAEILIIAKKELNKKNNSENCFFDVSGYKSFIEEAKAGNVNAIRYFLSRGADVDQEVNGESVASLALSQENHEVVLTLLNANSKFPPNFDKQNLSSDLKEFLRLVESMHQLIKDATKETNLEISKDFLKENLLKKPNLIYWYDANNNSLLRTSVLSKNFSIYEYLLSFGLILAPHEDFEEIFTDFQRNEKFVVKMINAKLSSISNDNPVTTLVKSCKLSLEGEQYEHLESIKNALDKLCKISSISIILKKVASLGNVTVFFDFDQDLLKFGRTTTRKFETFKVRRIVIPAKDLLNPATAINTIGVMAREFCSFVMLSVYKNEGKPYKKKDIDTMKKFSLICKKYEIEADEDDLILPLYKSHGTRNQHAELITKICQIVALYFDTPEVLVQKVKKYSSLFEFYEHICEDLKEINLFSL